MDGGLLICFFFFFFFFVRIFALVNYCNVHVLYNFVSVED